MIGKVLGAMAGAKVAERSSTLGPVGGAALGFAASLMVRRLSPLSILAVAAGAYAAKVRKDRRR